MNLVWACLLLFGGLVLLWKCADFLVSGAVSLARQLGVSPLIIGLTIVAMGTSAPEVAASIAAALRGAGDVAIGNVYGSNIANLALVGGIAALIWPIAVRKQTLYREMPVMILVGLLLWPVLGNLNLSRLEGVGLLVVFAVLIILTVHMARKEKKSADEKISSTEYRAPKAEVAKNGNNIKKDILLIIVGLAGLAIGADITVRGAVFIGGRIGLSQAVIGLTIIAFGTSLPELATCIVASLKRHDEISIGNLVGSNIFNTLLVTGTAGTVRPFAIAQRLIGVDYWVMIFVSIGFVCAAIVGRRSIGRLTGALLLCGYVAYIIYLLAFSV